MIGRTKTNIRRLWGAALSTLMIATTVFGWEKERITDDGIAVYSRTTTGTNVREVRAKMVIAAPPEAVFEAAMDPATFKSTMKKYVEKSRVYRVDEPNVWYNYQRLNLPVIAKRDYCLRYEKEVDVQKGVYRIKWQASSRFGPPPIEGVVRVTKIEGSYQITSDRKRKQSTIRYTLLTDPGGSIPSWLINFANRRSLPDILRQVKDASLKRVEKGK